MSNFNSPEFLKTVIRCGLLSPNADVMDAYMLHGVLLRDQFFRQRCLKVWHARPFYEVLKTLSPEELAALRERVLGVVPFRK